MQYLLDMVSPPSVTQARAMVSLGWTKSIAYIGGPRAAARNRWHIVDGVKYPVGDLWVAETFDGFLPTFNGLTVSTVLGETWDTPADFNYTTGIEHGDMANNYTGACGFGPDTPLALDIEYGSFQACRDAGRVNRFEDYVLAFVERVNRAGHKCGLYSDLATLAEFATGSEVDFKWGAAWVKGWIGLYTLRAPEGRFDPSFPPPWDLWQFGGGFIGNVSVDYNSASDEFLFARYG